MTTNACVARDRQRTTSSWPHSRHPHRHLTRGLQLEGDSLRAVVCPHEAVRCPIHVGDRARFNDGRCRPASLRPWRSRAAADGCLDRRVSAQPTKRQHDTPRRRASLLPPTIISVSLRRVGARAHGGRRGPRRSRRPFPPRSERQEALARLGSMGSTSAQAPQTRCRHSSAAALHRTSQAVRYENGAARSELADCVVACAASSHVVQKMYHDAAYQGSGASGAARLASVSSSW